MVGSLAGMSWPERCSLGGRFRQRTCHDSKDGPKRRFPGIFWPENTDGRRFLPLVLDSAKWLEYNSDKFGASSWGVG